MTPLENKNPQADLFPEQVNTPNNTEKKNTAPLTEKLIGKHRVITNPDEIVSTFTTDTQDQTYEKYEREEDFEGYPVEDFYETITVRDDGGEPVTYGMVDGIAYRTAEPIARAAELLDAVRPTIQQATVRGALKGTSELNNSLAALYAVPNELVNKVLGTNLAGIDQFQKGMNEFLQFVGEYIPYNKEVKQWSQQKTDYPTLSKVIELTAQYGINALPAATVIKSLTSSNTIIRGFMWGGIADAVSFGTDDPLKMEQKTIAQLSGITEYLEKKASKEEKDAFIQTMATVGDAALKNKPDTQMGNRFRMALEGSYLAGGIIGLIKFVPWIIKSMPWKKAKLALSMAGAMTAAKSSTDK